MQPQVEMGEGVLDLRVQQSAGELAIDIGDLRSQTGLITLDPGFSSTGACTSAITYIDGEKGILRYRGYPIEQLAEKASFLEVAYLLVYGELPTDTQLEKFSALLTKLGVANRTDAVATAVRRGLVDLAG